MKCFAYNVYRLSVTLCVMFTIVNQLPSKLNKCNLIYYIFYFYFDIKSISSFGQGDSVRASVSKQTMTQ